MRILIVDDNETNREFLIEALAGSGHSVTSVCNGRQALAAIAQEDFDVVLMDEEMPVMDGIEATRAIHQLKGSGSNRPTIVGLSGNFTDADKSRCLEAGMAAFLPKPVGINELLQTIDRCGAMSQPEPDAPFGSSSEDVAAHLHRITGGSGKLRRSLVKTFLADASKKLSAMRKAVSHNDAEQIGAIAHSMKGSLGLVGARKAEAIANELQSKGRSGNLDGIASEVRALEDEFERLRVELLALPAKRK